MNREQHAKMLPSAIAMRLSLLLETSFAKIGVNRVEEGRCKQRVRTTLYAPGPLVVLRLSYSYTATTIKERHMELDSCRCYSHAHSNEQMPALLGTEQD